MAPLENNTLSLLATVDNTTSSAFNSTTNKLGNEAVWKGTFSVASVDLIAMIVSDSGLSSNNPEWWNASPLGCVLIGLQPRGGWQIMQRAVQWGDDWFARAFGIKCDTSCLYQYFACTVRNRLEVWDSDDFISPTTDPNFVPKPKRAKISDRVHTWYANALQWLCSFRSNNDVEPKTPRPVLVDDPKASVPWRDDLQVEGRGGFKLYRPTKLVEGSKGGPAFVCSLLRPQHGQSYGINEQARVQMLSILLVGAGLMKRSPREDSCERLWKVLQHDLGMTNRLGSTFKQFRIALIAADAILLTYIMFVFYSVFRHNYLHNGAPYAIHMASLAAWSIGAIGLLSLGGNPRVTLSSSPENIPKHVLNRLYDLPSEYTNTESKQDIAISEHQSDTVTPPAEEPSWERTLGRSKRKIGDEEGNVALQFGYLHSTDYTECPSVCTVTFEELKLICGLKMVPTRPPAWIAAFVWFVLHLLASIGLQIAGSAVATLGSQLMGFGILVSTSILRGIGIASPEEWMIPGFRMRDGSHYGTVLLSKKTSRP